MNNLLIKEKNNIKSKNRMIYDTTIEKKTANFSNFRNPLFTKISLNIIYIKVQKIERG